MFRILIFTFFLFSIQTESKISYKGWQLYRFWPPEHLIKELSALYQHTQNVDLWSTIGEPDVAVDIAVKKVPHPSFKELAEKLNITYELQIPHIHKALNREAKEMKDAPDPEDGNLNFAKYQKFEVIMQYLKKLAKKHKDLVTLETIGTSVEDRDIVAVKISSRSSNLKPAVLINAGLSPREWIGPAQALYIIQELVENPKNKKMTANVDWYIIPIVNPDGYVYTHTKDRLWRKNRSQNKDHYGVHLNSNFDIHFGLGLNTLDEGSWHYHGSQPFSEPETQSLRKFIEDNASKIKLYLNIHSFGPAVVYPYSYTDDLPENIESIKHVAERVAEKIYKETQTPYKAKHAASRHKFSGTAVDWAMKKAGIPYAYTIELPSPEYLGFDFPVHRIQGVVEEFMIGVKEFYDFVVESGSKEQQKDEL